MESWCAEGAPTPPFGSPLLAPRVLFTSTLKCYVNLSPMAIAGTNVVTMRVDF